MKVIDVHNVSKIYNPDTIPVYAVNNVHLHFEKGEFTAPAKQPCSTSSARPDRRARPLMPFKYSVWRQVAKSITPSFMANLNLVYCPGVHAFVLFPVLTYSVSDNWDANLVARPFFAPEDGHFKNRGNALFFRLKWSF